MAFSSQRALSDGTLSDIELTIEYIDREDLKLFVDSVQIEDTIYSYEFITDNLIRITPDVAAGEEVLIQRQTRLESVLNVYADGAVFNNASMDENFRQMLLIAQEAREGATLEEIFNDLNLHGYHIRNLADGVLPQDAATKKQLDSVVSAAGVAAAASASAAASSANLAQRWANENEDVPVSGGLFSAKHWAAKSEAAAASATLSPVWYSKPIGEPFPLFTHLTGVDTPPVDNPDYRYIKLTAGDSYNTGALTSESVSGSAPLVQATAVISDPSSPLNGQTVRLINTERRVIRAGSSGVVEADALQNITGEVSSAPNSGLLSATASTSGAFANGTARSVWPTMGNATGFALNFDASRVARTANETRAKSIGADYFMRIR